MLHNKIPRSAGRRKLASAGADSFCAVPQAIAFALPRLRLTAAESSVLAFMVAELYRFRKNAGAAQTISLAAFSLATGLDRPAASGALRRLAERRIIDVTKGSGTRPHAYQVNPVELWEPSTRKAARGCATVAPRTNTGPAVSGGPPATADCCPTGQQTVAPRDNTANTPLRTSQEGKKKIYLAVVENHQADIEAVAAHWLRVVGRPMSTRDRQRVEDVFERGFSPSCRNVSIDDFRQAIDEAHAITSSAGGTLFGVGYCLAATDGKISQLHRIRDARVVGDYVAEHRARLQEWTEGSTPGPDSELVPIGALIPDLPFAWRQAA